MRVVGELYVSLSVEGPLTAVLLTSLSWPCFVLVGPPRFSYRSVGQGRSRYTIGGLLCSWMFMDVFLKPYEDARIFFVVAFMKAVAYLQSSVASSFTSEQSECFESVQAHPGSNNMRDMQLQEVCAVTFLSSGL